MVKNDLRDPSYKSKALKKNLKEISYSQNHGIRMFFELFALEISKFRIIFTYNLLYSDNLS